MSQTLFLASTPLHTFLSLGLMSGPFAGTACTLALIDRKPSTVDFIADAFEAESFEGSRVHRFPPLAVQGSPRSVLSDVSRFTAAMEPEAIVAGNDRRLEFYAAVRGWPRARRVYVDDGLYSYMARELVLPRWAERFSNWRRSIKYGLPVERPSRMGGSHAMQQAYVLLPDKVHAGLAGKEVHRLVPEWFSAPEVRAVCAKAMELSGLDPGCVQAFRLLILLPHHRFLGAGSRLVGTLGEVIDRYKGSPGAVAVKRHPASHADAATGEMLKRFGAVVEVPARLPVETLAPLLSDALVVGVQTTGLLSLKLLTRRVEVKSIAADDIRAKDRFAQETLGIYESAGIVPLDLHRLGA